MLLGGLHEGEFHVAQQRVIGADEEEGDRKAFVHRRIGKAFSHPVAVGFVSDVFANGGEVLLAVGVVHVRQERAAGVRQMHAAPEEVAGGAHLGGRDLRLREQATAEQDGNLLRVDCVSFGRAAVEGLHGQGMTEDERERFIGAEVGEPGPGAHAFDRHDAIRSIRSNGFEKGRRGRLHVTVKQRLTGLVEDADVHRTGMQVDAAVTWVLRVVKSH